MADLLDLLDRLRDKRGNPNHDERGRFSTGSGGSGSSDHLQGAPKPIEGLGIKPSSGYDSKDLASINPNWDKGIEWKTNCSRCATAVELRHRGYNVTANSAPANTTDDSFQGVLNRWESPGGLLAGGGMTSNGTAAPKAGETLGMSKGSRVFHSVPGASRTKIDAAAKKWGAGSRGYVAIHWKKSGAGHIFNVENSGGKIVYSDGQTGKADVSGYFDKVSDAYVVRTDDLTPTTWVNEWVHSPSGGAAAPPAKPAAPPKPASRREQVARSGRGSYGM